MILYPFPTLLSKLLRMTLLQIFSILFAVPLALWLGSSRQGGGSPIGKTDTAIGI